MRFKFKSLLLTVLALLPISYFVVDKYQEPQNLSDFISGSQGLEYLDLDKGKTRIYKSTNNSGERLVFLHGGGIAGCEIWRENINYLEDQGFDILTYDQYGKGYSERPRMKYSLDNLSHQLFEVVNETGFVEGKFSMITHSLGGMLAIRYLAEYPERIDNIILMSPGLLGGFKPKAVLKIPILSSMLMTYYWYWGFIEGRRKEFYDMDKFDQYAALIEPFSKVDKFKYVYKRTWLDILTEDVKNELSNITEAQQSKILVIFGLNDPYFNEEAIPELKAYLPKANYLTINEVGHNINFEKPDTISYLINNFISNN